MLGAAYKQNQILLEKKGGHMVINTFILNAVLFLYEQAYTLSNASTRCTIKVVADHNKNGHKELAWQLSGSPDYCYTEALNLGPLVGERELLKRNSHCHITHIQLPLVGYF